MTLPGFGDTYLGIQHCKGGACPHDHPDIIRCTVCDDEVDDGDNMAGWLDEPVCRDCWWCDLCCAEVAVTTLDGDRVCGVCADLAGYDEVAV